MKTIGVIASLPEELAVLEKGMQVTGEVEKAGLRFIEGVIGEKQVVATICGVGKVNGARTAQVLIDCFMPDAIIHTGVAGSLQEVASHLSLVVSTELTYHDADTQWLMDCPPYTDLFPADESLKNALLMGAQAFGGANAGRMVTGDRFIRSREVKEDILARCGGLCVDMETGATAHVAVLNAVPYCAIKCISDMADDSAGGTFEDFVAVAADKAAGSTLRAIETL
ncbi:MAG: 5'-methylthioadenosine/S-adenosylhomocysteine nucleosidase [Eubacteriales bacterium]|nr:5'-methylthioadenosine/S-adenosylhomocysteine nucleosidase [Eubacteriales bacterium]